MGRKKATRVGDGSKSNGGPLETGNTRWSEVIRYLANGNYSGPISLHSEYQGNHSWRDLTTKEVFEQTTLDAELFRSWMSEAQSPINLK